VLFPDRLEAPERTSRQQRGLVGGMSSPPELVFERREVCRKLLRQLIVGTPAAHRREKPQDESSQRGCCVHLAPKWSQHSDTTGDEMSIVGASFSVLNVYSVRNAVIASSRLARWAGM
jgi:hypothetical protein